MTDHVETDLALDSLDKVSLQSFIEETFGVSINADEMADFSSVADMCRHITAESNNLQSKMRETLATIDWHDILTNTAAGSRACATLTRYGTRRRNGAM